MAISAQQVQKKLEILRAGDGQEKPEQLQLWAQAAAERLESRRAVPGGDALLESAAAALANWQMTLTEPDGGFAAGDLRISDWSRQDSARQLWLDAQTAAAAYLRDDAFVFRRIL